MSGGENAEKTEKTQICAIRRCILCPAAAPAACEPAHRARGYASPVYGAAVGKPDRGPGGMQRYEQWTPVLGGAVCAFFCGAFSCCLAQNKTDGFAAFLPLERSASSASGRCGRRFRINPVPDGTDGVSVPERRAHEAGCDHPGGRRTGKKHRDPRGRPKIAVLGGAGDGLGLLALFAALSVQRLGGCQLLLHGGQVHALRHCAVSGPL